MKNQNLKEAFRELDKAYLKDMPSAPKEEMYYSPEYEKNMSHLLGKKKGNFMWKRFGKQVGAFALGAALALSIVAMIPNENTPKPVENETTWEYEAIDFVDANYIVYDTDPSTLAKENGYKEGTYEYEYLTILSEISYYTGIAEDYMISSRILYKDGTLFGDFFEIVSQEEFAAPYEDILLHACAILKTCGFAPAELSHEARWDYYQSLPYEKSRSVLMHCSGLSLANIHEKLTENAEKLIALHAKYPDYSGEFSLGDYVCDEAAALIEACKPVYENKKVHTEKWIAYYETIEATLEVTEEFVPELDAVKITITGNGYYQVPAIKSAFIENYEYEEFINSHGMLQKQHIPCKTVTIYRPVSAYYGSYVSDALNIVKYTEDKAHYDNVYYTYTLDPAQYYSDEPIKMNNVTLDTFLRDYFGGEYSERDLLCIDGMALQYFEYDGYESKAPELIMNYWNGVRTATVHLPLDLKGAESEEIFVEKLAEDLSHFHGLYDFRTNGNGAEKRLVSEELIKDLNAYIVNPD